MLGGGLILLDMCEIPSVDDGDAGVVSELSLFEINISFMSVDLVLIKTK